MVGHKPQTWTRVKRNDLRQLANEIGNEAMKLLPRWPQAGEGRAVKELTERIYRGLDTQNVNSSLARAYAELTQAAAQFEAISNNPFFQAEMWNKTLSSRKDQVSMGDLIALKSREIREFIAANPVPKPTVKDNLDQLVPDQKLGPVRFEFVSGVLRLQHTHGQTGDRDKQNAEQALAILLESGAWLIENMRSSNADARLVSTVEDIQTRLSSKMDVIQLGIANIACQLVFSRYEEELPDVIAAKMQAYSIGIGMYVSQYPEWIRFSENAAVADYNAEDIEVVYKAGVKLVENLRKSDEAVDPEVPRTIAWMLEAIRDPRLAARRSVFAAMRSIENLVIKVFSACGDILSGIPKGAKAGTTLATQGVVAVALLSAAAAVATSVSPSASKILQTGWLEKAGKMVLDALQKVD